MNIARMIKAFCLLLAVTLFYNPVFSQANRSYGGVLNNINTLWGSVYDTVVQVVPSAYGDGISLPAGDDRPNPRTISNMLFDQRSDINDPLGLSAFTWAWGQFIDHDITLSPNHPSEILPIPVPMGDRFFDPDSTGLASIMMMRSDYLPKTGTDANNPRRFYNEVTAFIDASAVYGTEEKVVDWLRTHQNGKLKTSQGNLLPYNTIDGNYESELDSNAPHMEMPFPHVQKFFVAGDVRANENPMLIAIHTIFVREHNRLCDEIIAENPDWNDEEIFQKARKIVGGLMQAIVYEEWLPAMGVHIPNYSNYNSAIHPGITNVFSTAAYRYGHTTINPKMLLLDNDGNPILDGEMSLRDAFFNPLSIDEVGGIEPFLVGGRFRTEQDLDCKVIDDLRNFLFGRPGQGGLDLVSLNINRGRDRGLPDFNTVRQAYGLSGYNEINEITTDPLIRQMLEDLYASVDLIDPWVGMLAEDHMDGALFGPTAMHIISRQFIHLRDGDRFYYEMDKTLTQAEIAKMKSTTLGEIVQRNTDITILLDDIFQSRSRERSVYRTIDGTDNNLYNPYWGAAGSNMLMGTPHEFSDKIGLPSGDDRPNPRVISNQIFAQEGDLFDPLNLSAYTWAWGQFIDHDITLSPENHEETISFAIPMGDPYFDPQSTGTQTMSLHRSVYDSSSGDHPGNPRVFVNGITAYLDGSAVYGSDEDRAAWLRSYIDGKLKTSSGGLLPYNTMSGEYSDEIDEEAPMMAMPFPHVQKYFVAGDIRANENPNLLSIHTIFLREHNRICDQLVADHPDWTDEELYQYARKIVGGKIQAIVYEEWLPTLGMEVPAYKAYNPMLEAGIDNVFATAAYRYGHTTIGGEIVRLDIDGNIIPEGNVMLRDVFFNPEAISGIGSITPYLQGMSTILQQNFDCHVVDDLRNFLFGPPGAGGLDLVALNIMRGRERGLADYNTIRRYYGMNTITSFDDLSSDPELNQHFSAVYDNVDQIDSWAGFLAENHMANALFGETAMYIIKKQFMTLRDGDYFYYENDPLLTADEIREIRNTTLAQVIKDNTDIYNLPENVFQVSQSTSNEEVLVDVSDFKVYPNPTSKYVNITWQGEANLGKSATMRIVDMAGRIVDVIEEKSITAGSTTTIALDERLSSGVYHLQLSVGDRTQNLRFVKIK